MKIKRTVNGQEIEFELTSAELVEAHDEFVTNFMKSVFIEDFEIENEDDAQELANMAYDLYCKGTGLTEYECCEQVFEEYGEDGHYHYNDGNIYCEDDMNPLDYFDFAGDFLSMSFEGNFYDIVNNSFGSLSSTRIKEFMAIIDKYGKHYELGDMWNLSLYDND